ncbi:hypothetical protein JW964_21970 [candidate division KSB1 bacterium]|nr:hypothetical protein [candidate division KSB1 bacterium]
MQIKKLLRQYYQNELEKIQEPAPVIPPQRIYYQKNTSILAINWSDAIGWLFMAGSILHYILQGRFFEIFNFIPGFSILL